MYECQDKIMEAVQKVLSSKNWPEFRIHGYYGFSFLVIVWRDAPEEWYRFDHRSSTDEVIVESCEPQPVPAAYREVTDEHEVRKSMAALSHLSNVQEVISMTGLAQNDVGKDAVKEINLVKKLIRDKRGMDEWITDSELNKMMED